MVHVATGAGIGSATPERSSDVSAKGADFFYDTFYGGAIGGSILALFFLIVDTLLAQPLATPSLVGTALFSGAAPTASTEVRMDMVAYFTALHFAAFLLTGAALAWMRRGLADSARRVVLLTAITFAILTGGFALLGIALADGIVAAVGLPWLVAGNLLTAVGMVAFIEWAHRPGADAQAAARG